MPTPAGAPDFERLWQIVTRSCPRAAHSIHGPDHWRRVEGFGIELAPHTGADLVVVRLFALFHDSQRVNDGIDPGHGARAAAWLVDVLRDAHAIDAERLELLQYACTWHTDRRHHPDPTIGTCWDADRLDLGRIGMVPDPDYMSTAHARELAARPLRRRGVDRDAT